MARERRGGEGWLREGTQGRRGKGMARERRGGGGGDG